MKSLGFVARKDIPAAGVVIRDLLNWAEQHHIEVYFDPEAAILAGRTAQSLSSVIERSEVVVTLGGDGTLVGAARLVKNEATLFLGAHFGTLGFLTEALPHEVRSVLQQVVRNEHAISTRDLLSVSIGDVARPGFSSQALNDVVIQKSVHAGLLSLDVTVDGEWLTRIRADGLIVSTPTGSTAYSLAAGGPIVPPNLSVFVITPICPHSLTQRPVVLSSNSVIDISVADGRSHAHIILDGQESTSLSQPLSLRINRGLHGVSFIKTKERGYFHHLRTKLNWGIPNQYHGEDKEPV